MDDEMNEDMDEKMEIDLKEIIMYQIETRDLFVLVDNYFWAYVNKNKWEQFQMQRNKAVEMLRNSKNPFEQMLVKMEASSIFEISEEEYKAHETRYKNSLKVINLLENDEDIQNAFYKRTKELDYDDSSIESKAKNFQIIVQLLTLSGTIKSIKNNTGNSIASIISDTLEEMPTIEILKIYEAVTPRHFCIFPEINEVLIKRIDEMSEFELFIFITDSNDIMLKDDRETNERIYNRIKKTNGTFSSAYIEFFSNDDKFLEELLKQIKPTEKVNAIVASNVETNHSEQVNRKMLEIINSFSDEELVRYLIYCHGTENECIAPIIQEKIQNLENEDVKFLFWAHDKMPKCSREDMFEGLLIERNLLQEYDGIQDFIPTEEEESIYVKRIQEYSCINRLFIKDFPFYSGFKLGIIDPNDVEESEKHVVNAYEYNSNELDKYEQFIKYITLLSQAKDEDLYKSILEYNTRNKVTLRKESDEKLADYLNFVILYLGSRILNINDERFLNKLYMLSPKGSSFIDTVITRMAEKKMPTPQLNIEVGRDGEINSGER